MSLMHISMGDGMGGWRDIERWSMCISLLTEKEKKYIRREKKHTLARI